MRTKLNIICDCCKTSFKRDKDESLRKKKSKKKQYCSQSCSTKQQNKSARTKEWVNGKKNISNLKLIADNQLDEYSLFRPLLSRCMRRKNRVGRTFPCNLDLLYIKELWEKQKGKCAITGVNLILKSKENKNYQASLDRIDSSKGYIRGNVRFVSVSINWLKNNLDDNHVKEFIEIIKNQGGD